MKQDIGSEIKGKIMLGALGHATSPEFAAKCLQEGIITVLPAFVKTPEELSGDIRKTRALCQGKEKALLGVNLVFYGRYYEKLLEVCNNEKIDFISMSAGFDKNIFSKTSIPVIAKVSSSRLAEYAESLGAAGLIIMGSDAGGHIGFPEQKEMKTTEQLISLIRNKVKIPLIAAGGLVAKEDIERLRKAGADAFQLGTRFVVTEECGVAKKTKEAYMNAKANDIVLVPSTTGLPLRVIATKFAQKVLSGIYPQPEKCINCLKNCSKKYCLQERIRKGMVGDIDEALLPASENTGRINGVTSIKDIRKWVG
ncbi:nitronate monooxygenase [Candidatus Woesearchaeota archaeon]|nr:nitronate monooxygenase [Candidatus Woesearchaeota archaeon]